MASYIEQEILSQPEVLRRLLDAEKANVEMIAEAVRAFGPHFTMLVARGSSDNAALYGKYLLGAANGMPVGLATPSLFTLYRSPPDLSRSLVVAISQSGESPDLLAVAQEARSQGALTVAVTNRPDSPLAERCRHVIGLHAGEERSVAATKSYTAQLMALAMLSAAMSGRRHRMAELRAVPDWVSGALRSEESARVAAMRLREAARCVVIGRGFDYATAHEIALKLKELATVAAAPYSSADFMHGPVAMVEEGFPVLLVAPGGAAFPEMCELAESLASLGVEVIAISDQRALLETATVALPVDCPPAEWLSPFVTVVPGQWLALRLALARGLDPDRPRRLAKVTRTR